MRPLETAPQVHGVSGLDGADLPEPASEPRPEGALEFLRATLAAAPAPVTLIPVGPLTNIGLLLRTYPGIAEKIAADQPDGRGDGCRQLDAGRGVQHLGGPGGGADRVPERPPDHDARPGRDPQGADGPARGGAARRRRARGWASVFADLLRFFTRFHVEKYGTADTPIHDAVAVAHVALPGLVTTRRYHVDVETDRRHHEGPDRRGRPRPAGSAPNVDVALDIDRAAFADLVIEAVASYR